MPLYMAHILDCSVCNNAMNLKTRVRISCTRVRIYRSLVQTCICSLSIEFAESHPRAGEKQLLLFDLLVELPHGFHTFECRFGKHITDLIAALSHHVLRLEDVYLDYKSPE